MLTSADFKALMFCDGETAVPEKFIKTLETWKNRDIVNFSDTPNEQERSWYRFINGRYVESVFWSITGKCNYRCRHCYMDAEHGLLGEADTATMLRLIDEIYEYGISSVDITGGEPFVRKDFWQLIDHLREKEIYVHKIYTNGACITEQVLREFDKRKLKPEFGISFDGIGWHDWMRGVDGAEQRTLDAIRLCKEYGYKVSIGLCAHKGNLSTIRESINLLATLGIDYVKIGLIQNTRLWQANSEGNDISLQEYIDLTTSYIPAFYEDGAPLELTIGGIVRMRAHSKEYRVVLEHADSCDECKGKHLCESAWYSCYITPDLRLLPCMPMTSNEDLSMFPKIYDVGGLGEALNGSFYAKYLGAEINDLLEKNEHCRSCEQKYICRGGCRAEAFLGEDHDLWGRDLISCYIYKNNIPAKVHEIVKKAQENFKVTEGG